MRLYVNDGQAKKYLASAWDNTSELIKLIGDNHSQWNSVRKEANECLEMDTCICYGHTDESWEYQEEFDRSFILAAAKRLIQLRQAAAVVLELGRRLQDIGIYVRWRRTKEEPAADVDLLIDRAVDVACWLLALRLRALKNLKIDAVRLVRHIAELEQDRSSEVALREIGIAERVISAFSLPISSRHCHNPKPGIEIKAYPDEVYGELTKDGFSITNYSGEYVQIVHLPQRLHRLLSAAREISPTYDDNSASHLVLKLAELTPSLRATASRTNIQTLRHCVRFMDGNPLLTSGEVRRSTIPFL